MKLTSPNSTNDGVGEIERRMKKIETLVRKLFWPERAPQAPRCPRGQGAQYKVILHCREAPACLSRLDGMVGELHKKGPGKEKCVMGI